MKATNVVRSIIDTGLQVENEPPAGFIRAIDAALHTYTNIVDGDNEGFDPIPRADVEDAISACDELKANLEVLL